MVNNRKARFNYEILLEYNAGIVLMGSEVKSIKLGYVSIEEAYCYFKDGELFIKNMYVKQYESSRDELDPKRDRKLLLKKSELRKLETTVSEKGLTLVPLLLTDKKRIKIVVGVGRGKKLYDKRASIKEKDIKKQLNRDNEI